MPSNRPKGTQKKKKTSIDSQTAIENKDQRYLQVTNRQEPHPPHKTTLHNRGQEKKKRKEKKMMVEKET